MKRVLALLILLSIAVFIAGCGGTPKEQNDFESIKTYMDIPGVTEEEIAAIEALKAKNESFSYGHLVGTEAFILPDGTYTGFTTEFCKLLSNLFGIEFYQKFSDWDHLKDGIDNRTIDFTGELSPTPERKRSYYMSHAIADRSFRIFLNKEAPDIVNESDFNGRKVGFLSGSVDAELVAESYPELKYDTINCDSFADAAKKLEAFEIDVFVTETTADPVFDEYDFIHSKEFFTLAFNTVSMTTANPELEPIISVIDKYLLAGGSDNLFELYEEGRDEYADYKLNKSFTDEERAYIDELSARNGKVRVAVKHDNYPVSFYNNSDIESEVGFQGIAMDVLEEVSRLTGIEFETVTDENTSLAEILEMLEKGEVSMSAELPYSDARKNRFIWAEEPYCSTHYALLSKADYPNLSSHQILRARVGTIKKSTHEDLYNKWFPDSTNTVGYDTQEEALNALEKGEIDLLMASENTLLSQTNYREKPGYKVNMIFNAPLESVFGFNKNEKILCSIINKSQPFINTKTITYNWTSRFFDYSKRLAVERTYFLIFFVAFLFLILVLTFLLLLKNKRLNNNLEELVEQRTHELERHMAILSTVYVTMPDLMFCKDVDGRYTSCNPSFEKFAGRKESELIGKSDIEIFNIDEEMAEKFKQDDKAVLDKRGTNVFEEVITYPDGTQRTVETAKTPLISATGECVGLLGVSRDVTNRKKTAETLKRTLDNLDTCIYIDEIETGEILFINKKMMEEFGGGSLEGKICWEVLQNGFKERCDFCPIPKLIESGDDYYIWEEHNTVTNKYYKNTDSLIMWQNDKLVHMQHSVDITDSVKLQRKLEAAVLKLETVVENYAGAIWSVDINRKITLFDGMLANKLGIEPDEVIERHMQEVFAKTPEFITHVENTFSEGSQNWMIKINDIILNSSTTPLKNADGETVGVVGTSYDVTESVNLQKDLEKASKAKSDFLSRMSHEIRTPMNAIIGMTNIAKNTKDPAKNEYCLDKIENASKHLMDIINDILDMTKIEADKYELFHNEFDLEKMLMGVVNVIGIKADEKHQTLVVDMDDDIPMSIVQDELRLTQVITNLLSNAVKFTPEKGTIILNIKNLSDSEGEPNLRFEIIDNGIGISAEQQRKLFTSFEQADGGIARKYGGTGLGLAISKRIVELMGGKIWVESELDKGSKFIFTMKFKKGSKIQKSKLNISKKDIRILAVDDSPEIRDYFTHVMAALELSCDVAADGFEALHKLAGCKDKPYNIFFVDWQMPMMDGIDLTRKIKEIMSDNSVIIMISVTEWSEIEKDAVAAGVDRFIPKPLFPSVLINTINECLGVVPQKKLVTRVMRTHDTFDYRNHAILIAEDVEVNREIIAAILEDTEVSIDFAGNGLEALDKLGENPDKYSLILMDIHMPEMDGYEATRRIRAFDSEKAKNIPIVAMTANVFQEDIKKCLEAGMNNHIGKPIDPDDLFSKLDEYLPRRPEGTEQTAGNDAVSNEQEAPLDYASLLPVMDVQNGIDRLKNNKKIYFTLLKNFNAKGMTDEIVQNINNEDFTKTAQAAHALKGTAANLGLTGLSAISASIEGQAKAGMGSAQMLEELTNTADATIDAIRRLLNSEKV